MDEQPLAEKRLTLSFEFSRYLIAHPEVAERMPPDAAVIFIVDDDPVFTAQERQLAKRLAAEDQAVVTVHVRGLAPPIESRLIEPHVELTPP